MKYDFDRPIERRRTDSLKWDHVRDVFGSDDVLPMWVADMDFQVARPITEALRRRTEHEVYGYTAGGESLREAIVQRLKNKYGWAVDPAWIVFTPGVVPVLHAAVRALAAPGDEVVVQSPVYYPFFEAVQSNGCQVVNNPLRLEERRYVMDFEDLERQFGPRAGVTPLPNRVKLMIVSSPHNPTGRVWTRDELERAGSIAVSHGAIVVSDEIHCELMFNGARHTPFASISNEFAQHSITCIAPSKTFNVAGLAASAAIVPAESIRTRLQLAGGLGLVNTLGLTAFEAAYRHGDEWLEQVLAYIQANYDFLVEYVGSRMPLVKVTLLEGTYLVWLDFRELGFSDTGLMRFMREKAKVGCDDGFVFGEGGQGFQRMNIACPRAVLGEALGRIDRAIASM